MRSCSKRKQHAFRLCIESEVSSGARLKIIWWLRHLLSEVLALTTVNNSRTEFVIFICFLARLHTWLLHKRGSSLFFKNTEDRKRKCHIMVIQLNNDCQLHHVYFTKFTTYHIWMLLLRKVELLVTNLGAKLIGKKRFGQWHGAIFRKGCSPEFNNTVMF